MAEPPPINVNITVSRVGVGTIVFVVPLLWAARWRMNLANSGASVGTLTGVSLRHATTGTNYGPPVAAAVPAPVTPGNAWGATDAQDVVENLEVTLTVSDSVSINVTVVGY